jgi:hypothetical protein
MGDCRPTYSGVNNWMTYVTGDIPVGAYDSHRLANLGIGHGAIDAGGGYTYFDPKAGNEFSATLGFTYNFENPETHYKNGIDMHRDLGASKFLTKEWQIGVVEYFFNQISCDSGSGARLGCFESRIAGAGPQIGYIFPLSKDYQGYINIKGYKDFAAEHRAEGWNAWLTFAISTGRAERDGAESTPLVRKRKFSFGTKTDACVSGYCIDFGRLGSIECWAPCGRKPGAKYP